ncbi:Transcriptional regulator, LysR family [hydrothermal vent metagenome]|uniref:Transcriptional regulator, LysR family n=1 Tax=hydrothermal vent metagenome TaxID=652676 RepID=A0A3B0XI62_9ZZZZ
MDTETLHLFAEVMRQRSFTSIAKARGVAPSSISRSISALEAEVGARLFQRTTRKIVPTEAGLLYYERINTVLEDLEVAGQLVSGASERPHGSLRITASNSFSESQLVPLMIEFNKLYPMLSLALLLCDGYTDLVEERIDVAIRVGSLDDSTYVARRLSVMTFYVVASPAYLQENGVPKKPEQISEHSCLVFPRSGFNVNWLFKQKQKIQEIAIQGKHVITQSGATKQCTLAGMGLSLLPDWLIKNEIEKGELITLFNDFEVTATDYESAVWMLYPSREYLPMKVKVFRDFLLAHYASQ